MHWTLVILGLFWPCPATVPVDNATVAIPYSPPIHLGIDLVVPVGTPVVSAVPGVVTFAGDVAFNRTVTVQPYPGVRVTVSYLSETLVKEGDRVNAGDTLGRSGHAHFGIPAVHLSLRFGGDYTNPELLFSCKRPSTSGLRLLPSAR